MPRFSADFYKPHVLNQDGRRFPDVLNQIARMNAVDRIRRGADPAAVLRLQREGNDFFGEAARIRMQDLPSVVDMATGNRHDLEVLENEGLGEEIHFLYDADLDVIAIQNKGHFRPSALERLLGDLTATNLDFRVILTEDAWERFQRMHLATKLSFKLSRPHDLAGEPPPAVNRVFQQIDEFNGVSARVEITIGRARNRGLNMEAITGLVAAFQRRREDFRSLSIAGAIREAEAQDARSHPEVIDFIKERLLYVGEVPRRGRGRRLDAAGCRVALRRAIREHQEHLRRYR